MNIIQDPWYQEGLKFKCTGCGQCCTGSPGYVWVNEEEILKIAAFLEMDLDQFAEKYLRIVDERVSLLEVPLSYDCVFLKDKKCQIYPVRPKQCQTFPWWPQNLESKENWKETARHCEGISESAPLVDLKTIQKALQE